MELSPGYEQLEKDENFIDGGVHHLASSPPFVWNYPQDMKN
jgi:hypothetical protein